MNNTIMRLAAVVAALLTLGISTATAGLIEVDQTIYGMDCAPCAYGMEKGLKKLEGVEKVKVSLNKGNAVMRFTPTNHVTLAEIRQTVRDSGFTPKGATVRINGTLTHKAGKWRLEVGKATYFLKPANKAKVVWRRLQRMATGTTVEVSGRIEADSPDTLTVLEAKQ